MCPVILNTEQFIAAEVVSPLVEKHLLLACHIVVWVAVDSCMIDRPPDTSPIPAEVPGTLADKVDSAHWLVDFVGIVEGEVDLP